MEGDLWAFVNYVLVDEPTGALGCLFGIEAQFCSVAPFEVFGDFPA